MDEGALGDRLLGRITADDIEAAFRALEAEGLAGQTLNKYLQTCQHLQRWALRKGYIQRAWFDADNRPHVRSKPVRRARRLEADVIGPDGKVIKDGEERRLLAVANPWMQRLIIAAIETGCRRGELLKLQWRHVDLTRGHLKLPAELTKTAEGRTVVISARLRPVLELVRVNPLTNQHHEASAYVFGNAEGKPVASPKKAWEVCVLKAHGIKPEWAKGKKLTPATREKLAAIDLHFHDLRHEAGSRWIEAGWPIHHVQQMLGHADLKQTSTYLNATVNGLQESMRKMDERRGLVPGAVHIGSDRAAAPAHSPVSIN
jgi:integrase